MQVDIYRYYKTKAKLLLLLYNFYISKNTPAAINH